MPPAGLAELIPFLTLAGAGPVVLTPTGQPLGEKISEKLRHTLQVLVSAHSRGGEGVLRGELPYGDEVHSLQRELPGVFGSLGSGQWGLLRPFRMHRMRKPPPSSLAKVPMEQRVPSGHDTYTLDGHHFNAAGEPSDLTWAQQFVFAVLVNAGRASSATLGSTPEELARLLRPFKSVEFGSSINYVLSDATPGDPSDHPLIRPFDELTDDIEQQLLVDGTIEYAGVLAIVHGRWAYDITTGEPIPEISGDNAFALNVRYFLQRLAAKLDAARVPGEGFTMTGDVWVTQEELGPISLRTIRRAITLLPTAIRSDAGVFGRTTAARFQLAPPLLSSRQLRSDPPLNWSDVIAAQPDVDYVEVRGVRIIKSGDWAGAAYRAHAHVEADRGLLADRIVLPGTSARGVLALLANLREGETRATNAIGLPNFTAAPSRTLAELPFVVVEPGSHGGLRLPNTDADRHHDAFFVPAPETLPLSSTLLEIADGVFVNPRMVPYSIDEGEFHKVPLSARQWEMFQHMAGGGGAYLPRAQRSDDPKTRWQSFRATVKDRLPLEGSGGEAMGARLRPPYRPPAFLIDDKFLLRLDGLATTLDGRPVPLAPTMETLLQRLSGLDAGETVLRSSLSSGEMANVTRLAELGFIEVSEGHVQRGDPPQEIGLKNPRNLAQVGEGFIYPNGDPWVRNSEGRFEPYAMSERDRSTWQRLWEIAIERRASGESDFVISREVDLTPASLSRFVTRNPELVESETGRGVRPRDPPGSPVFWAGADKQYLVLDSGEVYRVAGSDFERVPFTRVQRNLVVDAQNAISDPDEDEFLMFEDVTTYDVWSAAENAEAKAEGLFERRLFPRRAQRGGQNPTGIRLTNQQPFLLPQANAPAHAPATP